MTYLIDTWLSRRIGVFLMFLGCPIVVLMVSLLFSVGTGLADEGVSSGATGTKRQWNVLLITSYHAGYSWTDQVESGIRSAFLKAPEHVELSVEYLDTNRHPPHLLEQATVELFRTKYAAIRFDVILVADNDALSFMERRGESLFPQVPVVFAGINDRQPEDFAGRDITGVLENFNAAATIELALRFHPNSTRLILIGDDTISSHAILRQVENQIQRRGIPVQMERWVQVDHEELLRRASLEGPNTLLYFTPVFQVIDGQLRRTEEVLSSIASVSAAPVYSNWDFLMGHGIVGGYLLSGVKHGKAAGEIALRVLAGEDASSIPVNNEPQDLLQFDARELSRFGIKAPLPPNAEVLYGPSPFVTIDKNLFWTILASLIILATTLMVLIRNIIARNRAIAQRDLLEQQLFQSQRMEAIGTLASGISHDFNNILGAVGNSVELALMDTPEGSPAADDLNRALKATQRGTALVRQLLSFGRPSQSHMEPIDLNESVREVAGLLGPSVPRGMELRLELPDVPTCIVADANQIHQLLMNLGTNAIESLRASPPTKAPGYILMEIVPQTLTQSEARSLGFPPAALRVHRLTVRDNGPGVPVHLRDRIFDPFFTTRDKAKGTGLGLAVVQSIVRIHRGALRLREAPGAVFDIFLRDETK